MIMEEEILKKSTDVSDEKIKKLWKQAITLSLDPDNSFPAYKIYYLLVKNQILSKSLKVSKEEVLENDEENLHNLL